MPLCLYNTGLQTHNETYQKSGTFATPIVVLCCLLALFIVLTIILLLAPFMLLRTSFLSF